MGYFEFPHTRTYDSDLGWLIKHVHQLITEFGSIEKWRGIHETEYQQLKDIVDGLTHSLIDVVVPWDSSVAYRIYSIVEWEGSNYIALQDVPVGTMITNTDYWAEADTVVEQINAIANVTSDIKHELSDGMTPALSGVYMGDFITSDGSFPQGMVRVGNKIYTLSTYDNTANECLLRIFDMDTNREYGTPKTVIGGHGNGFAYCPDNNSFYIAPIWDRTDGTAQRWNVLIKYDADFNHYTLVPMPVTNSIMACAYDYVSGTLYALGYDRMIYSVDPFTDEVLPVESVAYAFDLTTDMLPYNQVFAIYDGAWAISDPHNFIRCGHLGDTWLNDYIVPHLDSSNCRHLGEIEGMNYTPEGNLIAMFTTSLTDDVKCGVITQLSARIPSENGAERQATRNNASLVISADTQARFRNSTSEIRSLRQMAMMNTEASRIAVQGTVEEPGSNVRLVKPVTMNLSNNAYLKTGRLQVSASFFSLAGAGTIEMNSGSTAVIYMESGGQISLNGDISIMSEGDIDVVNCSANALTGAGADITIYKLYTSANNHNLTMQHGSLYTIGRFSNNYIRPMQIETGYDTVTIPSGESYGEIEVTFTRPFKAMPNVYATVFSTSNIQNNIPIAIVAYASETGARIRFWRQVGAPNSQTINPLVRWIAIERN